MPCYHFCISCGNFSHCTSNSYHYVKFVQQNYVLKKKYFSSRLKGISILYLCKSRMITTLLTSIFVWIFHFDGCILICVQYFFLTLVTYRGNWSEYFSHIIILKKFFQFILLLYTFNSEYTGHDIGNTDGIEKLSQCRQNCAEGIEI